MRSVVGLVVACAVASAAAGIHAQPIYRCDDGRGSVLFTDEPCKGGTKVEVQAGKADPAAIERLRRDQEAFARRQAARDARAQAEAEAAAEARRLQRERAMRAAEGEPVADVSYPPWAWGGISPWPPMRPLPPPRPQPVPSPGFVPAAPAHPPSPPPGRVPRP